MHCKNGENHSFIRSTIRCSLPAQTDRIYLVIIQKHPIFIYFRLLTYNFRCYAGLVSEDSEINEYEALQNSYSSDASVL